MGLSNSPVSKTFTIEIDSEEDYCIRIPAPYRGILKTLRILQKTGAVEGFAFSLYDREAACPANTSGESYGPGDDEKDFDAAMHRIGDAGVVTAGTRLYDANELKEPYHNRDPHPHHQTTEIFAIYLHIRAPGSGAKQFEVGYVIMS